MPIFDQGYQHWDGRLAGHSWRWLAVTRQGVRQQTRRRTKWLVAAAFIPALMLAAVLVFWGLLERQSGLLQPVMIFINNLPEEIRSGPKAYRVAVWTMAFNTFLGIETFFAMLLVLAVGPDLVSQDLRFNAMPLYFSRPLRRFDYFLGKLGVIAVFLAEVAVAPAVAAWLLGVAFSFEFAVVRDTWRLLVGALAYGAVVVVSAGTLMLAISALSRNSRLVGATWVGLWVVGNVSSGVLTQTVKREWCPLVSYTANLDSLREELLVVREARQKFVALWKSGQRAGREVARAALPFGRKRRRRLGNGPPSPPPPQHERPAADRPGWDDEDNRPTWLRTPEHVRHPWTWSAGVLAGLFAISALTLASRIKTLDRLR